MRERWGEEEGGERKKEERQNCRLTFRLQEATTSNETNRQMNR